MMKENKTEVDNRTELEQNIDEIIEKARKTSNTFILNTAKLIKSELSRNKYSENRFLNQKFCSKWLRHVQKLQLYMIKQVVMI